MADQHGRPVFIGTVAVDAIHHGLVGTELPPVTFRWGGVVSNMACAVGALGCDPLFVSVGYQGELRWAVADHLAANGVTWVALPTNGPLPFFHAKATPSGGVAEENFIGAEALKLMTPELVAPRKGIRR